MNHNEAKPTMMGALFWGELSPVDSVKPYSKEAKDSHKAYTDAYDALSEKLRNINPELDHELDNLFSVFHVYIGYMHESAFLCGYRVGMQLTLEAMNWTFDT